jgi:hypothetical protein
VNTTPPEIPGTTPSEAGVSSPPEQSAIADGGHARRIADWLRRIRLWARVMLVSQRVGWIVGGSIVALVVGGFADFFLRAPMELRLTGLILAAGVLGWFIVQFLIPALRFRPRLTEIALRVERSRAGKDAHVRGLLASGLELGRGRDALPAPALASPVIEEAAERLTAIRAREVFSARATLRGLGAAVAAVLMLVGLSASWPHHTRIGLERMLWPIGGAEWPKRTEIADAMTLGYHPLGAALEFRASLIRSETEPEHTNVAAHYRILTNGAAGPERTALLAAQPQTIFTPRPDGTTQSGTLFERLIEPTGLTPGQPAARAEASSAKTELEYWFESDDDATPRKRVLLVEPPTVLRATAQIVLPEYAAKILGAPAGGAQKADLGPGSDDRAAPAPILAGSRMSVAFELNKPVAVPGDLDASSEQGAAWIRSTLGPEALALFKAGGPGQPSPGATLRADGRTWTLSWQHWDSVRLIVKPTDEYHIAAGDDAVFRFDALKDNPPTASVTIPMEDKSVLPTAVVELAGEGRDDVALSWVSLERQLARKNASSEGSVPEPAGDRTEMVRMTAERASALEGGADAGAESAQAGSIKRIVTTHTLDLSGVADLRPGDELWITALASDAYELAGQRHEAVRSSVRKLRILSREQLVEQIWSELGTLRRTAIKIDQDQADIAKLRPQSGPAGADASSRGERAQAGLTERLSRQNQAVQRLQTRIKENGLTDQGLSDVIRQASETLGRAGAKSGEASKSLGDATREQTKPDAGSDAGEKEIRQSDEAQQGVRDELSRLIDMLDQGEDSFASKRSVERMLEQQKALRERTDAIGRQTAGRSADELNAGQREALDKVSQEQKALADALRDAVKKMQERQSKVRDKDPAAAEAMAQAAAQALRDQTAERMDDASKDAAANQTSSAQQQQQQAIASLEQMLDKMQKAQSNKDEILKRSLATLLDSLNGLIAVQEGAIGALKDAATTDPSRITALEPPMVTQHQNTLGVLDQASNGPRELSHVADLIEKASEYMAMTVPELRDAKAEPALGHEGTALDRLREARDEAQKLDQQASERQNDRKREELRAKYQAALKIQTELRDSADGLVGVEATRRTRAQARSLGEEQGTLKETVDRIREETKAVADAKVFNFAHDRLDTLMASAAATLLEGGADGAAVRAQTSAARLLKSLADALDDRAPDKEAFRENQGGGGGGGSGGDKEDPVVPNAAELVLLRMMQQEALDLARSAAEDARHDPALVSDAATLQGELSKQASGLLNRLTQKNTPAPSKAVPKPEKGPEKENPE